VKPGDLVRWKSTGKLCIYLGLDTSFGEGQEIYRFYSAEYGIVDRWIETFDPNSALEVVQT
jgi:hypothetical protein